MKIEGAKKEVTSYIEETSKLQNLLMMLYAPLHLILFASLTTTASGLRLMLIYEHNGHDEPEGDEDIEKSYSECLCSSLAIVLFVNSVLKMTDFDTPALQALNGNYVRSKIELAAGMLMVGLGCLTWGNVSVLLLVVVVVLFFVEVSENAYTRSVLRQMEKEKELTAVLAATDSEQIDVIVDDNDNDKD